MQYEQQGVSSVVNMRRSDTYKNIQLLHVSGILVKHTYDVGYAVAQLVEGTVLQAGRSRVRFTMVPLKFFFYIILTVAVWPWG